MNMGSSTSSLLGIGVQGMQQSLGRIDQAASNIARAGISQNESGGGTGGTSGDTMNIATNLVDMTFNQHIFDASAKIIKSADEMIGTVLDIRA
jgi:hypothetical protein